MSVCVCIHLSVCSLYTFICRNNLEILSVFFWATVSLLHSNIHLLVLAPKAKGYMKHLPSNIPLLKSPGDPPGFSEPDRMLQISRSSHIPLKY